MRKPSVILRVRPSSRGFTLVEMLAVMAIIALMVGLSVSAFKGGAGLDATKGASVIAASEFDAARNEAIMRQTPTRVVIDTDWYANRTDLLDHYLRRMTVAYLDPTTGYWMQSGAWTVLPSNVYIDINYSVLHGADMQPAFGGSTVPSGNTGYYSYYQFTPNGQTPASLYVFTPPASNGAVNTTLAQCVVSVGNVNATTGTFQERGNNRTSTSPTAPGTCYGFVLYRMGHMSFFLDNSQIQQPST